MSAPTEPIVRRNCPVFASSILYYWSTPTSSGDSPLSSYTLTCSSISYSNSVPFPISSILVENLPPSITYIFQVFATNFNGNSGPPATFIPYQTGNKPGSPRDISISRITNGISIVTWSSPTTNGGAQINFYGIWSYPTDGNSNILSNLSSLVVKKYTYGNQFTRLLYFDPSLSTSRITVRAINNPGWSVDDSNNYVYSIVASRFIPTFSPSSIIYSLQTWYDAEDPLATGTAPATSTIISTWFDKSGNNRSTLAGSVGAAYTIDIGGSYLTFDGSSTRYFIPGSFIANQYYTVFVVERLQSASDSISQYYIGGSGNTTNTNLNIGYLSSLQASTLRFSQFGNDLNGNVASFAGASAQPTRVWTLSQQTSNRQIFVNGSTIASNASNALLTSWADAAIGYMSSANTYYNGQIKEVLFYTGNMTSYDRQEVEGYLAWKWGTQSNLPITHPFYISSPTSTSVFSPNSFSSLHLWIDAADATKVSTTLGTSTINALFDKSPNARTFINVSGYFYAQNSFNTSYPSFSGTGALGNTLGSNSTFTMNQPYTAFFVGKNDKTTGSFGFIFCNPQNTTALYYNNNDRFSMAAGTGVDSLNITGTSQSNMLITSIFNVSSSAFIQNGSTITSNFNPGACNIPYGLVLGQWQNTTQAYSWGGKYCELLMYNRLLSTDERQTIEGYLAWKWGLQSNLPLTHPYKFRNPSFTYRPSDSIPEGSLINFIGRDYISSSTTWSNTTGTLGAPNNAILLTGGLRVNSTNNGIFFSTNTSMRLATVGTQSTFTISTWYRRQGLITGGYTSIISDALTASGSGNINFALANPNAGSSNTLTPSIYAAGAWYYGSTILCPPLTWINITYSWNNATKQMKTYSNATLLQTSTMSSMPTPSNAGTFVYIGARYDAGSIGIYGEVGQVILYNRALSDAEVTSNYNAALPLYPNQVETSSLILQYTASSYSGSGASSNTGTLGSAYNATITAGTPAKNTEGNGVFFNSNLIYQIPNFGQLFYYTQMIWFKRTGPTASLMCQRYTGANYIVANADNDTVSSIYTRVFYNQSWFNASSQAIVPDRWYNVTYVWTGNSYLTYIDGTLRSSNALAALSEQNNEIYYIGCRWDTNNRLRGYIGEIRMYNGALTSSQILSVYQATSSVYSNVQVSTQMLFYYDATSYSGSGTWSNLGTAGSRYNATVSGTPVKNSDGNGISFNSNLYYSISNYTGDGPLYSYTQSIWFKRDAVMRGLYSQRYTSGIIFINNIIVQSNDRTLYGGFYYNSALLTGTAQTINAANWCNITCVWNGTSFITYMNGIQTTSTIFNAYSEDSSMDYVIGANWDLNSRFIGDIGEVRMYNGPLTSNQIFDLYTSTSTKYQNYISTQMYLYYNASNYTGAGTWSNLGTLGPANNAGIAAGTPSKNAVGNGVVFNGSLNYSISTLNKALPDFTYACWMKRTGTTTGGNNTCVFTQQHAGGSGPINFAHRSLTATTIRGDMYFIPNGGDGWINGADITLAANTWIHIAATFSTGVFRTYSNGVILTSTVNVNTFAENSGLGWFIGQRWDNNQRFTGEIGEIRMYRGVLSGSEISTLYGSTLSGYTT